MAPGEHGDHPGLARAALVGSVTVRVAEDEGLEAVDDAVEVQVFLDREFGAPVVGNRVGRVRFRRGSAGPRVRRRGRPPSRRRRRGARRPGGTLRRSERPEHIGARVEDGLETLWRTSICAAWCETRSIFSERRSGPRFVSGDVGLDEAGARRAPSLSRSPVVEVVHDDDLVPVGQVPRRHARADEAGPAGDQNVHRLSIATP